MSKISKENIVSLKEFNKLKESLNKFEKNLKDQVNSLNKSFSEKINKIEKNFKEQINKLANALDADFKKSDENVNNQLNEQKLILKKRIDNVAEDIVNIQDKILENQKHIQEKINSQENNLKGMIQRLNENFTTEIDNINKELDGIMVDHDILKVSFSVNEQKMVEKIESFIFSNIRAVCEDKEREILMRIWIEKLKNIISDFEEMKKLHPKEFTLRLDEIANTIEVFKKKIT